MSQEEREELEDDEPIADVIGKYNDDGGIDLEPIVDSVGKDADESGLDVDTTLDIVDVPVIGDAAGSEEPLPGDTGEMPPMGQYSTQDDGGSFDEEPKKRHIARNLIIALVIVILLALGACAGWLCYDDTRNASCHVPQGVSLDGTDISGFSASEVKSVVAKHVVSGQSGSIELTLANGTATTLEFAKFGNVDVQGTVDAAMALVEPDTLTRCINRAKEIVGMADPVEKVELSTVCKLSKKKVKARVESLASQYDAKMQNAGYKFDTDAYKVKTIKAKEGYQINVDKTVKRILRAAKKGEASVAAADEKLEPTKTTPGQAIFVSLSECHLYFYVDGKVSKDYPCTPGMSGYETPSGDWTLEYKDAAPTWYNPHSDWSSNMPETIAPGASNPLGLRALALSCGGGIYIHGTTNTGQLGTAASHGCIRLANANVVELFDLVETGIPIFVH